MNSRIFVFWKGSTPVFLYRRTLLKLRDNDQDFTSTIYVPRPSQEFSIFFAPFIEGISDVLPYVGTDVVDLKSGHSGNDLKTESLGILFVKSGALNTVIIF